LKRVYIQLPKLNVGGSIPPRPLQSLSSSAAARSFGVAFAGLGGLAGRSRPRCGAARGRGFAAELSTPMCGGMAGMDASTRAAGRLAAAVVFVDGGPGASLGFLFGDAAPLVALGDVVGLAFLLVGVFRFVAARHAALPGQAAPARTVRQPFAGRDGSRTDARLDCAARALVVLSCDLAAPPDRSRPWPWRSHGPLRST